MRQRRHCGVDGAVGWKLGAEDLYGQHASRATLRYAVLDAVGARGGLQRQCHRLGRAPPAWQQGPAAPFRMPWWARLQRPHEHHSKNH